jgi:hypothetical protein
MLHRNLSLSIAAFFVAGIAPLSAHHSAAAHFDMSQELVLDGVVTDFRLVNPHGYFYFDVTSESGEISNWRCELAGATGLKRRGWTVETLVPGQRITVNGSPARREDNHCFTTSFTLGDGTEISRQANLLESATTAEAEDEDRPQYLDNGQPNISGYWVRVRGPGGGQASEELGLTAAAKAVQAEYEFIYDVPAVHCDIGNIYFGWTHDGLVNEVKQFNDRILLRYGYMDYLRTIHLDMESHPDNIVPTRGGHSIGHWEGDTLVVDTIGFSQGFLAFQSGIPHSDQMHSVEKFWLDDETETLIQSYVAEDPAYLNNAYTGQNSMELSVAPYEPYNCVELSGDNNVRPN